MFTPLVQKPISMGPTHEKLNRKRSEGARKPPEQEAFLEQFNDSLASFEEQQYEDIEPRHPFLFIMGLPRSGTTLLSQLIAHSMDVGYINNLAARFWRAPVTGIRFSQAVIDTGSFRGFKSSFGATQSLADIHEFGYFWRDWLKKESFENIKSAQNIEESIDWEGLKKTLANMQARFDRPMVFKNIFGSYHIAKLNEVLEQTLWIYIERDPLDTAVSILKAREKYFNDLNNWWSYVPPEYEKIIDMDYWHQIAGQIHYLKKFYHRELEKLEESGRGLSLTYSELCKDPGSILQTIQTRIYELYSVEVPISGAPPSGFELRTYDNQPDEKQRFRELLNNFD